MLSIHSIAVSSINLLFTVNDKIFVVGFLTLLVLNSDIFILPTNLLLLLKTNYTFSYFPISFLGQSAFPMFVVLVV
jgi:hypothetical protein